MAPFSSNADRKSVIVKCTIREARCRFSATESGASHYCWQPTCPYACSAYEARVTNRSNARFWIAGYSNAR